MKFSGLPEEPLRQAGKFFGLPGDLSRREPFVVFVSGLAENLAIVFEKEPWLADDERVVVDVRKRWKMGEMMDEMTGVTKDANAAHFFGHPLSAHPPARQALALPETQVCSCFRRLLMFPHVSVKMNRFGLLTCLRFCWAGGRGTRW